MIIRFRIWHERRIARLISRYQPGIEITCQVRGITVGRFRNGSEVNR